MANAAFYVDELKITEKGKYLVIEGRRRCPQGHAVEEVFITAPIKLEHLFAEIGGGGKPALADSPVVAERLRKYSESN